MSRNEALSNPLSHAAVVMLIIFALFMVGTLFSELTDGKSRHQPITYKEYWDE